MRPDRASDGAHGTDSLTIIGGSGLKRQKTNRAYRTVDLLEPLAEDVTAWVAESGRRPADMLFVRESGRPWMRDDWNNWRNRHFAPATTRAGLGIPRPYDLRHSFASLLIQEQRTSIVELAASSDTPRR